MLHKRGLLLMTREDAAASERDVDGCCPCKRSKCGSRSNWMRDWKQEPLLHERELMLKTRKDAAASERDVEGCCPCKRSKCWGCKGWMRK